MKKLIYILAALFLAAALAPRESKAQATELPTFVMTATATPAANQTFNFGFQNQSTVYEVQVKSIDLFSCSSAPITGGILRLDVHMASSYTDSNTSAQVGVLSHGASGSLRRKFNYSLPSGITASTAPVSVVLETSGAGIPLLLPALITTEETALVNLIVSYDFTGGRTEPLILPRSGTRGIVVRKVKQGATDFIVGCIGMRTTFTIQ